MHPCAKVERNAEIARLYQAGQSTGEIADAMGISVQRVSAVLAKLQVPRRRFTKSGLFIANTLPAAEAAIKRQVAERAKVRAERGLDAVPDLHAQGLTFSEIGAKLGISRSAVSGLVHRARRQSA